MKEVWANLLLFFLPSPIQQIFIKCLLESFGASFVAQLVKNPPAKQETWVRSLDWEDPLEKGKVTHSSILAWRIPWTAESMGSQRVWHDWAIFTCGLHFKIFQENLLKMQNYQHRISRDTTQYLHLKSPESSSALLFPGPVPMVSLTTSPSSPLIHKAMSRERPSPNIAALITS